MIQPQDIRRKANNLYPIFLRAWLAEEAFFPRMIPCRKRPDEDLAVAGQSIRSLRDGSKEVLGYGYLVEWAQRNSRTHGRNLFPQRILFETPSDFLRYVGKQAEFALFADAVQRIRSRCPELEGWVRLNYKTLIDLAAEVEGLVEVVEFFRAHPRPMVFAREIPISVDTKFIERHRAILREWLDRALPPQAIRADEEHFERRYGLRYAEPHLLVRLLDPAVQRSCGCSWPECSIPLHTLAAMQVTVDRVLIVENKVNLLTLPPIQGSMALGGLGNGVTDLRYLQWLGQCPIWYWGDIDAEGFAILARLRSVFPQTQSLLMDHETVCQWKTLAISGTGRSLATPMNLTESEHAAYALCAENNLRIEQERLPHQFVLDSLQSMFEPAIDSHSRSSSN